MSEVDPNRLMFEGLDTLWAGFTRSPLGQPLALQNAGLCSISGNTGFRSWAGEGNFYGHSYVELTRDDGAKFMWNLGVLYEQGSNDGEAWEQGGAYAYVAVNPGQDEGWMALYTIGSVALPAASFKLTDLVEFARHIADLAEKCLDDLEYAFQSKSFDHLLMLGRERNGGHDQWTTNPLRSEYYA